jgi:hypothetical protein
VIRLFSLNMIEHPLHEGNSRIGASGVARVQRSQKEGQKVGKLVDLVSSHPKQEILFDQNLDPDIIS